MVWVADHSPQSAVRAGSRFSAGFVPHALREIETTHFQCVALYVAGTRSRCGSMAPCRSAGSGEHYAHLAVTVGSLISYSTVPLRFRNLPRMSSVWYYESEGSRQGPVSRMKIEELIGLGAIRDETLVWTEGMTDWRPCSEVAELKPSASSEATPVDESELETCAYSGKRLPRSAMLPFGDEWVAFEHRQEFIQRLQEGREETEDPLPGYPFAAGLNVESLASQSWTIWTKQLGLIMGFAVILWLPVDLLVEFLGRTSLPTSSAVQNLANFFVGCFVNAGVLAYALHRWTGGGRWSLGRFLRGAGEYYGKILFTRFLFGLMLVPLFIPFGIAVVGAGGSVGGLIFVGILAFVLVAFLGTRLGSAEPLAVILNEGGPAAIKQSWTVSRGRFWRLLLYRTIVYVPVMILTGGMLWAATVPGLDYLPVRVLLAVIANAVSTFYVVFEMVIALHLQANPLPPKEAVSTLPSVEGPHDPAA